MFGLSPVVIFGVVVVNVPVWLYLGKVFFGDWEEFGRCIKFWLTPDAFSFFNGQWDEDRWAEMKLGVYFLVCGLLVACQFGALAKILGTGTEG